MNERQSMMSDGLAVTPEEIVALVRERFVRHDQVWGSYTLNLTLEALLIWDLTTGETADVAYVREILRRRNKAFGERIPWTAQPFCHIDFRLYQATGDECYAQTFIAESERCRNKVPRMLTNLASHDPPNNPGRHLLIDFLQDYACRMAQAGRLSGVAAFYDECVAQYKGYRQYLRDPDTGLWHTALGWQPDPLAPTSGAWSRGHGWLLRGLVESLEQMPRDSTWHHSLAAMTRELADALLQVQQATGLWHQLLHLPVWESYPDSTGTGFLSAYLRLAWLRGILPEPRYRDAADRAFEGLKSLITQNGLILHEAASAHETLEACRRQPGKTSDGTGHAPATTILACAAQVAK